LPKTTEAQVLGKQVLRSGTSVGANYREAYRARSRAEFIAKCGDSLRELEETTYWLELLVDGKIVPADKLSTVRHECDELTAIFVTILKRSKEAPLSVSLRCSRLTAKKPRSRAAAKIAYERNQNTRAKKSRSISFVC
jgi:four helix bundle protein